MYTYWCILILYIFLLLGICNVFFLTNIIVNRLHVHDTRYNFYIIITLIFYYYFVNIIIIIYYNLLLWLLILLLYVYTQRLNGNYDGYQPDGFWPWMFIIGLGHTFITCIRNEPGPNVLHTYAFVYLNIHLHTRSYIIY